MTRTSHDLRAYRVARKITQRDFAARLGVSVNELMRYERGFTPVPQDIASKLNAHPLDKACTQECGEGYVTARPSKPSIIHRTADIDATLLPVIDLFCGVGGFSHGFEQTGRFQVTAGIDLLGDRLSTFAANHSSATAFGTDIRQLSIDELDGENPRPFVIVGGPPCQGFSSLRPFRNVEWNDPRNNLGEEFVRIVAALKPEWIVFENVVGLLTHGQGKSLNSLSAAFKEIGYRTSARVLNGAHFGLPQKRERLILVGNKRGKAMQWPEPTHYFDHKSMAGKTDLLIKPQVGLFSTSLADAVTFDHATHDLPELQSGEKADGYRVDIDPTPYELAIRNGANALTMHEATRHSQKMLEIIRHAGSNIHALPKGMVTSGFSSCYSRLCADEPSTTITVNFVHPASNRCIHPRQDRALTPREGARLQSFRDTFAFRGTRSQIVKQIGNAVPPLIGSIIANAIIESD